MIYGAKWIIPITKEPIEDGAVAVNGTKIEDVGTIEAITKKYPDKEVKDFGLSVIMPGLVDAHTHLEYSVFRGVVDDLPFAHWKIQLAQKAAKLNPSDWQVSADLGAIEAVQSGITTIADITKKGYSLKSAKKIGLRGVIFYEVTGLSMSNLKEIMAQTDKTIKEWRILIKGSNLEIAVSPYSTYTVAPQLYKAVSDYAIKNKLRVCTHVAGSIDEEQFVKYASGPLAMEFKDEAGWADVLWQPTGESPVKYIEQWDAFEGDVTCVHCVHVSERDLDILAKYNVKIVHCPGVEAKLGMGIAPLKGFKQRNLTLGIGTDSPASNNTFDMFEEMRLGLLLQRGVDQSTEGLQAKDFIEAATLGGAKVLGLQKDIGTLEPGKEADIIAVDLSSSHQIPTRDPYSAVVYGANQEDVVFTMVGGNAIYQKEIPTLAEEEALAKAEEARNKLRTVIN